MRSEWVRVNRHHPCPICGKPDWCGVSADGSAAICMRTESDRPVRNGGWVHRLTDAPPAATPAKRNAPKPRPVRADLADLAGMWQAWLSKTGGRLSHLAELLSTPVDALRRLGAAWADRYNAWAFPMRDPIGEVIGIRLRSETGDKWAVKGSRQGLFIPDGQVADTMTEIWFCEGPTDAASLLGAGIYAVGRPSCAGGHDLVLPLAVGRDVVILADHDEPKNRPDGTTWRPGEDGANRLAAAMFGKVKSVKVIRPPFAKDARQWINAGASGSVIRSAARHSWYWRPKDQPGQRERPSRPAFVADPRGPGPRGTARRRR